MTLPALPLDSRTRDGVPMTLRRIGPEDFDLARRFLSSLSRGTRYFRFGNSRFIYSDDELRRLCTPAPQARDHVIAVVDGEDGPLMVGSARYVVTEDGQTGEFALMILDGWARQGIGQQLMLALEACARARGLRAMTGRILGSNRTMLEFAARVGYGLDEATRDAQIKTVTKTLGAG
jgi:acetyltransferase